MSKTILLTNVVYGPEYSNIFLNYHLKSLIDESNLPSLGRKFEYVIYTDQETEPILRRHDNILRLLSLCEVDFRIGTWRGGVDRFEMRYNFLVNAFNDSVRLALEKDSWLGAWVADLVFAQGFFKESTRRLDEGHDAVFVLPARGAFEPMSKYLNEAPGARTSEDLWQLTQTCLHPLWVACHWHNPNFSRIPFSLIWNSQKGMLVRSYSITPILFKPAPKMGQTKKVIDVEVSGMFSNPYWCHNWDEAPVVGCEPLHCYYPPFQTKPAGRWISSWSERLESHQHEFLKKKLYYPNQAEAGIDAITEADSNICIQMVLAGRGQANGTSANKDA